MSNPAAEAKAHPARLPYGQDIRQEQYMWTNFWWRLIPSSCTVSEQRKTAETDVASLRSQQQSQQQSPQQVSVHWTTRTQMSGPIDGMAQPPAGAVSYIMRYLNTYSKNCPGAEFTSKRSHSWAMVDDDTLDMTWTLTKVHPDNNRWGEIIGTTTIRYKRVHERFNAE
jgi:hypothetical protein